MLLRLPDIQSTNWIMREKDAKEMPVEKGRKRRNKLLVFLQEKSTVASGEAAARSFNAKNLSVLRSECSWLGDKNCQSVTKNVAQREPFIRLSTNKPFSLDGWLDIYGRRKNRFPFLRDLLIPFIF